MSGEVDLFLGRRIRLRRRQLGLTQQRLGAQCGVSFQQIQKYECGANRISAPVLWKVATALDCSVDFFFDGATRLLAPDASPKVAEMAGSRSASGSRT